MLWSHNNVNNKSILNPKIVAVSKHLQLVSDVSLRYSPDRSKNDCGTLQCYKVYGETTIAHLFITFDSKMFSLMHLGSLARCPPTDKVGCYNCRNKIQ